MLHTVAAFMVLLFLATGAVAAVQVRVTPASASATVGSTVTVTVEADSVADLGGFQFGFAYSATDMQAVSTTVNPAFDLIVANDPGAASGSGMIAAAVFNNPPLSGAPVTLATLEFKLLTPVTGTINLVNVILGQVGGAEIPSTAVGGSIAGSTFSKANQTIGTIGFSPAILTVGGATTVNASASSALAVSFSSKTPTICTVSGNTVTGVSSGTCTITADQAGDGNYNAATQVTQDIAITPAVCTPPVSGLISWWKGEGNTTDTINAGNGSYVGTPSYTAGKIGQAFNFNGIDQYVDLVIPGVNTSDGAETTVSFWMYWNGLEGSNGVMPFGFNTYDLWFRNGSFGFNTGASDVWGVSSNGLANHWVHVTALFHNGDARLSRLYLDGVEQVLTQRLSATGSKNVSTSARIGLWTIDTNYLFGGSIDELQIYNRALSATEIQNIYSAGAAGVCTGLPTVALSDSSLDLGSVILGTASQEKSITVTNTGSSVLNIGVLYIDDYPEFSLPTDTCSNRSLIPGSSCSVGIKLTPTHINNLYSSLHIPSNAAVTTVNVSLTGFGANPTPLGAWVPASSGTTENLTSVWGTSVSDLFATGANGTILHYNGSVWNGMNSGTTLNLNGIWGNSSTNMYAVGNGGTILQYDGTAWSSMSSGVSNDLSAIWGSSSTDIFAAGRSNTILHYDGTAWSAMTPPSGGYGELGGVWGSSGRDVYINDWWDKMLHYDGTGWSLQSTGVTNGPGIWGNGSSNVYAGAWNTMAHYNGSAWSSMSSPQSSVIMGIWGDNNSDIYAVGYGGSIITYNGASWNNMVSGTGTNLISVWGKNSDVFVVGDGGTILHYTKPVITPSNGATGVSVTTNVTIAFGEAVNADTINQTTIVVKDDAFRVVSGAVTFNSASNTATFTPASSLASGALYTITVSGVGKPSGETIAPLTSIFTTETTCYTAPSGLISWWKGNGNANDSHGSNNGTLINGATFAPGKVGQAFSFDGVNQFVSITDSPSLRPKDLTIETWVKFSSVPSMAIIAAKTLGSVYGDSFFLDLEYGKLNGGVGDNSGFGKIMSYPFIPELNAWYHLTYTFDDSTKTQALYINGQQVATGTQATSIAYDSHPVLIGADINSESPGYYFPGLIDEVKIYNRSLSVDEIAAIYNAGSAGVCVATVPGAPASVTASAGNSQATVNFTEPASNGGSVITGYTVTATPGGITATGATSPITVTGLTNGTSYTFTVTATNSVGSGAASVASSPVTPISDGTYYSRNLVVNGDAESVPAANTTVTLFPGWATDGNVSILGYNSSGGWPSFTDPGPENRGNNFFYGGSVGTSAASQEIDISFASNDIDAGNARFDVSAWIGGYSSQGDMAVVRVAFYGAGSQLLGTSTIGPVLYTDRASMTGLLYRAASGIVPANARRATISMEFTRIDGSANDGYLDNVSFMLAPVGSPTTQKSSQTIGAISFLPGTLTVGATTTVSAAATSGLPVGFNSSTPGVCTVNGTIVSGVSVGTCTVNADQSGNATYSAAPQVTQNIAVLANPVNGVCGTSNGVTFIAAPTTNFCTSGTATAVSGSGPWNWSCNGSNGGSTASCSAGIQSYTVSFVSGGNGTLSGTNSQTVNYGGSATTVTALSAIGYHFVNWTEGALVAGSTSVLTVTNVTAAHTFVANFAADPFGGICGSSNGSTFRIAPATNLCSTGSATTVSGSGPWNWSCIGSNGGTTATCSAAVDITGPAVVVSTLADGAITNNATLNVSGTVSDASGVAGLTVNNAAVPVTDGSFSYAVVLQAGSNTVVTIATDTVGNSTTDSRIITLDDVAPALTVSAPADNSKSAQGVTTVTGTVNETATVTLSVNSGTPQSASLTGNAYSATVNLAAGLNSIAITATDLAGNKTSAARTVTYDNTKPSLAITTPGQDITTAQNSITISGTVSDTITSATVVITYNGESYSPAITSGVFSQQLTIPTEGIYTITATATDEAGNSSSVTRNVIYAIPVNGACGTSNGGTFSVVPTTYLCSAGSASDVTGNGPWSWTCSGSDGGTVANCSADKLIIVPVNQLISFGTAPTLTYGGANGAVSASATSGLPVTFSSLTGDICTVSSSTVSPRSAGTCIIAANQGGNGNYNAAAQVTQAIVIAKAVPVITWDNPADIFSGTPLSAAQLNATASVPGDFSYNPASGTILNAGAGQTLSASFIPKDTGNYTGQSTSVTLSVIYVDTVAPVISAFTVPATAATLSAVEIAVTATDNVGVIGYLVTESATVPVASDTGWTVAAPTSHTFATWGNHTLSAYAKDAAGNVSALASRRVYIGENPAIDGVIVPESSGSPKYEPALTDALKSLNFAMKVEQPNPTQLLHGRVAPLVNGVPQPDPNRSEFNLGDTVVILRRVIGLQ